MKKHRSLNVLSGPLLFLAVLLVLAPVIEFKQAAAIATIFWMGLWWVLRPVNIAVTSLAADSAERYLRHGADGGDYQQILFGNRRAACRQ